MPATRPAERRFPPHGWLGIALVALFWILNWTLDGVRTHWGFFPLWLGYALAVDGLVVRRLGDSLLTRSPRGYALLFIASIPAWWLFELLNRRTGNWSYEGREQFTLVQYALFASLNFSTVMPAVFGTAELIASSGRLERLRRGPAISPTRKVTAAMFASGWAMLALLLLWPRYFFPFLWGSVYLIVEPVNIRLGRRSLLRHLAAGDWRPVVALAAGALVCGFFWEMWNVRSFPRWTYDVPYVGWLKIFEMPILGYLGYPPFALELFALYHLIGGAVSVGGEPLPIRLTPDPAPPYPDSPAPRSSRTPGPSSAP